MDTEQVLRDYVEKVLHARQHLKHRLPSEEELREAALELGFSEKELALVADTLQAHLKNGWGYQKLENWTAALQEYQEALKINPYHGDALLNIAFINKILWEEEKEQIYANEAKTYARRCLEVMPGNKRALRIIDEITRDEENLNQWGCMLYWLIGLGMLLYCCV